MLSLLAQWSLVRQSDPAPKLIDYRSREMGKWPCFFAQTICLFAYQVGVQ